MPASVIVGLQWGDEGKGKAVDLLSESVDMVVRYQGGDNAGHTVVIGDEVFKLHLVPSGVLHGHITPVIGSGVVVNPRTLIHEMSHFNVTAGTDDYVYGSAGALNLAITDPAKATNNADNHEYFAEKQ